MTKRLNLLMIVASDDAAARLHGTLERGGFEVRAERVRTPDALGAALRSAGFNLAFADERSPAFPRLRALATCRRLSPDLPVIVLLNSASVRAAVAAVQGGAEDALRPGEIGRAAVAARRALRRGPGAGVPLGLFESVFESGHYQLAYLDAEFNFVRVNKAYARAAGHPPAHFVGRNHFELYPHAENEIIFRRVRDTGRPFTTYAKPFDYPDDPGRGTTYWDWSLLPVRESGGRVKGFVLSLVDVTERVRADRRLEQAKRLEALGTMAGVIAHDFNNILMPILLNTEMALLELGPGDPARSSLSQVLGAARLGKDLAGQIIRFSRPAKPLPENLDAAEAVRETLRLLETSLPRNVRLQARLPDKPCRIEADRAQIHQVVMNLCKNGIEAMSSTGGVLSVKLEPRTIEPGGPDDGRSLPPGRYWLLTIADTGAGIPPESLDKIFDPFFTSKTRTGGTGLGLAMVPSILKNHGGAITVESRPGAGTTFRIHLPRARALAAERPQTPAPPKTGGTKRILLVDDEPDVLDCLRAALERLGHQVAAEADPERALAAFERDPDAFDLVITDRLMPGMGGEDLAARLSRVRPGVPIVLCTGDGERFEPAEAGRPGARDVLRKPFSTEDIAAVVERIPGCGPERPRRTEERRG